MKASSRGVIFSEQGYQLSSFLYFLPARKEKKKLSNLERKRFKFQNLINARYPKQNHERENSTVIYKSKNI